MSDAEAALKRKYELLNQKKLEKQKSSGDVGSSETVSSPAAPLRSAPVHTSSSSIGLPRLGKPKESGGDVVISAASIDRSQIEFFKSTNKQKATMQRPDSEASKKAKLPPASIPKKEKKPEGSPAASNADESVTGGDAADGRAWPSPAAEESAPKPRFYGGGAGAGDRKEGFLKNVHDALEKIFREVLAASMPACVLRDAHRATPASKTSPRVRKSQTAQNTTGA